jgi:hypothetical protein
MASKYGSSVDVQAAFNKFDVNKDGVLDRDEMVAVHREIESQSMRGNGTDGRQGVSSEVLEAQVERIETFVVAVHGSCNALHEALAQAISARLSACVWNCAAASHSPAEHRLHQGGSE